MKALYRLDPRYFQCRIIAAVIEKNTMDSRRSNSQEDLRCAHRRLAMEQDANRMLVQELMRQNSHVHTKKLEIRAMCDNEKRLIEVGNCLVVKVNQATDEAQALEERVEHLTSEIGYVNNELHRGGMLTHQLDERVNQLISVKTQLNTELDNKMDTVEELEEQVQQLTTKVESVRHELGDARVNVEQLGEQLEIEKNKHLHEKAQTVKLSQQLDEVNQQLADEKSQKELLANTESEARSQLERLKVSFQEMLEKHNEELREVYQKREELQRRHQEEMSECVSKFTEQLQCVKEEMQKDMTLMEQASAAREQRLHKELEELKTNSNEDKTSEVCPTSLQLQQLSPPTVQTAKATENTQVPEKNTDSPWKQTSQMFGWKTVGVVAGLTAVSIWARYFR